MQTLAKAKRSQPVSTSVEHIDSSLAMINNCHKLGKATEMQCTDLPLIITKFE
jgi:hypothetical protein